MNIVSVVGVSIVLLGGLVLLLITLIIATSPRNSSVTPDQYFALMLQLIAFSSAGLIGGGFGLYHCIRSFIRKPSANLRLPWFWIFLLLYGIVIAISFGLQNSGNAVTFFALSAFLIVLAAIFPALTLLALGVRRLRFPTWPTTWRRFTLALTSGATSGIGIALALELLAAYLLVTSLPANNALNCVNDPTAPGCGTIASFNIIFLFIAVIGPVIEETVKPLALIPFIGRIRSASEAFVLGMACGIGFAVIETVGYMGLGYQDWPTVALERTGASLLHGFGAGMVALGWYYLFHAKKHRFLKAIGCYAYAVFQHFTWNATLTLAQIPGTVGTTINSWNLNLGFTVLPFVEVLNIFEVILMLIFFIYITGRIRATATPPPEPRNVESARGQGDRKGAPLPYTARTG